MCKRLLVHLAGADVIGIDCFNTLCHEQQASSTHEEKSSGEQTHTGRETLKEAGVCVHSETRGVGVCVWAEGKAKQSSL